MTQEEIAKMSDKDLHQHCQTCGVNIRKLQKEFAGYLSEVEKRKLYKKYEFYSLYEYAAKLAGMSHATVDEILKVHSKLSDKPVLKNLITEQGWGKLKVVATIATPETQEFWAKKVKEMSSSTLQAFVKETRGEFTNSSNISELRIDSSKPMETSQKSTLAFKLDAETETKLRIFKQKLEKQTKEPQDWNQVILELLKQTEQHQNCQKKKTVPPKAAPSKEEIQKNLPAIDKRYIPADVRNYIDQKYGGKCAYPGCKNAATSYHHTRRFSLVPNHDPDFIVPVCTAHERLAHHGLIQSELLPPENWKIQLEPDKSLRKFAIDLKVQNYRVPK